MTARARSISLILLLACSLTSAGAGKWVPIGPFGGQVSEFVFHPDNPGIVFSATGHSLYRSTDRGVTWNKVTLPSAYGVDRIRFGPERSGILYLASGQVLFKSANLGLSWKKVCDFNTQSSILDFQFHPKMPGRGYALSNGFLRTTDSGATWKASSAGLPGEFQGGRMALDPQDPNTVYLALNSSVYKTVDGGVSWVKTADLDCYDAAYIGDIVMHPVDSRILYAGMFGSGQCTLKSTDAGRTWRTVGYNGSALSINPVQPSHVLTAGKTIAYSLNDGRDWQDASTPPRYYNAFLTIAVHPLKSNVVFAGSELNGIYRSTDEGRTWTTANNGVRDMRIYGMSVAGPGKIFAVGNNWQLYRKLSDAAKWSILPELQRDRVEQVALYRPDPGFLLAVGLFSNDTNVASSTDGGKSWEFGTAQAHAATDQDSAVVFHGSNPKIIVMSVMNTSGAYAGIGRSTDGGKSWALSNSGLADTRVVQVVATPGADSCFFVLTERSRDIFRSTDAGATWNAVRNPLKPSEHPSRIAVSSGRVYLLARDLNTGNSILYATNSLGNSWSRLRSFQRPGNGAYINIVAADENHPSIVFCLSSYGSLFSKSTDGGRTWVNFPRPGGTPMGMTTDPYIQGRYYVNTDHGIYAYNEP